MALTLYKIEEEKRQLHCAQRLWAHSKFFKSVFFCELAEYDNVDSFNQVPNNVIIDTPHSWASAVKPPDENHTTQ